MKQTMDKNVIVVFEERKSKIIENITDYLICFSKANDYTIMAYDDSTVGNIAVVPNGNISDEILSQLSQYNTVIMPFSEKSKGLLDSKMVGYSLTDDSADITAKNITDKGNAKVFEVLTKNEIGRIILNNSAGLSVQQALALYGLFTACGTQANKAIQYINSL